jgi:septal ring factor EnvC (AmiA/AmiB activator)
VVLSHECAKEKAVGKNAQAEAETLSRTIKDLKDSTDKFVAQIPALEEKVKHLDNKVIDTVNDARAKELSLERVTKSNEDYKSQNAQLTRKLESKLPFLCRFSLESCSM